VPSIDGRRIGKKGKVIEKTLEFDIFGKRGIIWVLRRTDSVSEDFLLGLIPEIKRWFFAGNSLGSRGLSISGGS